MADASLRIWVNQSLPDDARRVLANGAAAHELVFSDRAIELNIAHGEADPVVRDSDIAFGQPNIDDVIASPRLKWVHLSTAGYTRYDRPDVRAALESRGTMMTTSSTVFADACAQHVLAMMMAMNRRLPHAQAEQRAARWAFQPLRYDSRVLTGQTALIVGLGSIGRRLIELLAPFRMQITAVRRSPRPEEMLWVRPMDQVDRLLPHADHVVNLLPSGANTHNLFNADRFARMNGAARFYNVGRGDTVDQPALLHALRSGAIAGAYLDVTTPEPLPPDHPLWTAPNCFITPHTAGGQQYEFVTLVNHFVENLGRFDRGEALRDRIM
jgi:phosphoglycerate dehydrogenase-like enzyme